MRPRPLLLGAIAGLGAIFSIHLTGCSLAGLGVGAVVDQVRATRYDAKSTQYLYAISRHTPIELLLRDSSRVAGRFEGWSDVEDSTYAAQYESWRAAFAGAAWPPALGARIRVLTRSGERREGPFRGFGFRSVSLGMRREATREFLFGELDSLVVIGQTARSAESLSATWVSGQTPVRTRLRVGHPGHRIEQVAPDSVESVSVAAPKHGKIVGLLAGVTADALIVTALVQSFNSSDCGGYSGGGYGYGYLRTLPEKKPPAAPAARH